MHTVRRVRHYVSTHWKRYILLPMVVPLFAFFLTGCSQQVGFRWSCDGPASDAVSVTWIGPYGYQHNSVFACTDTIGYNNQDWGGAKPEIWVTSEVGDGIGVAIAQNGTDTCSNLVARNQGHTTQVHCLGQ